jgi:uncharacterized protein YceH (UPF0502 family)
MFDPPLSAEEGRVLGCLIEKDLATPEYYPLSLNALTLACNQKTNREPVVEYGEELVREAIGLLKRRDAAEAIPSSRVVKYGHRLGEMFNLRRGDLALLAVLLLRGPQTLAEIRERAHRMHPFEDAEAVEHAIRRLPEGTVVEIPRQPGQKESRWAQLLTGPIDVSQLSAAPREAREPLAERVLRLEEELARLRADFDDLRRQLG